MADTYQQRRGEIETYFDRTAAAAWSKLTSDAPVSGIRATVRAGRDRMRATLLSFLPDDLRGAGFSMPAAAPGLLPLRPQSAART
jgi:magnesium-protoporphyrin O-methyltransferase